jgi:hypothetical protein
MKLNRPNYIDWIVKLESNLTLPNGQEVETYKINYDVDEDNYNNFAKHVRNHYISDEEAIEFAIDEGISTQEYLRDRIIPNPSAMPGRATLSGEFAEIIYSDLLEYILEFETPRIKFINKDNKDTAVKNIDIISFKCENSTNPSIDDILNITEVKAGLSTTNFQKIKEASDDVIKRDPSFVASALNFYKRKLKHLRFNKTADKIKRFQNSEIRFNQINTAASITMHNTDVTNSNMVSVIFEQRSKVKHYLIYGPDLWNLAKEIYRRAIENV